MIRLVGQPGASGAGRARAQTVQRLCRDELSTVRTAALAWRNGIAGLLAGLLGFSLVKGRSNISQLAMPWGAVVGVLLLTSLVVGLYSATRLLVAAHGHPTTVARDSIHSRLAANHAEAARARQALDRGITASLLCAGLLVAAVGTTWYGPERQRPRLLVTVGGQRICGAVVRVGGGLLTIRADGGERTVNLAAATGITTVDSCAGR